MTARDAVAGAALLAALLLAETAPLAALASAIAFALTVPKG